MLLPCPPGFYVVGSEGAIVQIYDSTQVVRLSSGRRISIWHAFPVRCIAIVTDEGPFYGYVVWVHVDEIDAL